MTIPRDLSCKNDSSSGYWTFPRIADYIEKNYKKWSSK